MDFKKLQDKALMKMALPLIDSFLMPFLLGIIKKAQTIEIDSETESEVGLLLLARGEDRVIVCAPIFSKDDKIVRYQPMNEAGDESVDLTELIKSVNK